MTEVVKQRYDRFAQAYVINGFNGALAARIAGYSPNRDRQTAKELVTNSYVKAKIAEIKAKLDKKADITADYVVNSIKEIAEAQKESQPNTSLKAFELLGRNKGIFELDNSQLADKALTINILPPKE